MRRIHLFSLTAIALFVLLSFTQCGDAKDKIITKLLEVQAAAINKECPKIMNKILRLDSCQVSAPKTLKTYYTIISGADLFTLGDEAKKNLIYATQTNQDLKKLCEYEVAFSYAYYKPDGTLVGEITVTPEDYNKPLDESNKSMLSDDINTDEVKLLLEKELSFIKEKLPVAITPEITLVECNLSDKQILYVYETALLNAGNIDTTTVKASYKAEVVGGLKNLPQTVKALEKGYYYKYIYKDTNSKYLFTIDIAIDDLK